MFVEPEELRKAAAEFRIARKEYDAAFKRMDDAMEALKGNWESTSQQMFYSEYDALHQYMDVFGKLVTAIANEMNNLADNYEKADKRSA